MANCTITNVPGRIVPLYMCGARMTYFSAIMPIADGMGLVFAVTSYDGRIVVSPTSCRDLMPDPERFAHASATASRSTWRWRGADPKPARAARAALDRHGRRASAPGSATPKRPRLERPPLPFGLRQAVGDDLQHERIEAQPGMAAGHADVLVQRGSPSIVASCGGTTPSLSEYRQLIGIGGGLLSRSAWPAAASNVLPAQRVRDQPVQRLQEGRRSCCRRGRR